MRFKLRMAAVAALTIVGGAWSGDGLAAGSYDMNRFIREPHPFAKPRAQAPQPAATPAPARAPAVQAPPPRVQAAAPTVREPLRFEPKPAFGFLSELRGGFLVHDEGPFSRNKEDGFDTNVEILFTSPAFLDVIWAPRPHVGGTINSSGNTSQAYLGLTWEWEFLRDFFFDFSFGGAVHDGETTEEKLDAKQLGCSVLFREAIDVGYRFNAQHAVMFHFAHISNGKLCDKNEGLETFGARYGYRF